MNILGDYMREEEIDEIFQGKRPKDLKIKVDKAPPIKSESKKENQEIKAYVDDLRNCK